MVPTVRLELTRLAPPPPQDGVSTNFTTSAQLVTDPELYGFSCTAQIPDPPESNITQRGIDEAGESPAVPPCSPAAGTEGAGTVVVTAPSITLAGAVGLLLAR